MKEIIDIQKYNKNNIKLDVVKLVNYIKKNFPDNSNNSIHLKKFFGGRGGDIFLDIEVSRKIKSYIIILKTDSFVYDLSNNFDIDFLIKNNIHIILNLLYNFNKITQAIEKMNEIRKK